MKLTRIEIIKLCESGGMAPSGGNIQPWNVIARDNILELKLDPSRSSSFLDIGNLASYFSLGSFFENLIITAQSLGLSFNTKFMKFKDVNDVVIKIVFTDRNKLLKKPHNLEKFIAARTTNRQIFDGTIINDKYIDTLKNVIKDFGPNFTLTCLSNYNEKEQLIDILGKADVIRTLNDTLNNQMFNEIRWNHSEAVLSRDGIDLATMELPANAPILLKQVKDHPFIRKLLPNKVFENMAKPLLLNSSHLCCLSMSTKPLSKNMFLAGQLMERLWLTATKLGLAVHPWTILPFFLLRVEYFSAEGFNKKEASEISKLGQNLRNCINLSKNGTPLFIFRLSKAKSPSARSLRLSWEDYTKIQS